MKKFLCYRLSLIGLLLMFVFLLWALICVLEGRPVSESILFPVNVGAIFLLILMRCSSRPDNAFWHFVFVLPIVVLAPLLLSIPLELSAGLTMVLMMLFSVSAVVSLQRVSV